MTQVKNIIGNTLPAKFVFAAVGFTKPTLPAATGLLVGAGTEGVAAETGLRNRMVP